MAARNLCPGFSRVATLRLRCRPPNGQCKACTHRYKYRLYYRPTGGRIVGFDNERGKGDHFHLGDEEFPYDFKILDKLLGDFEILSHMREIPR
ncbi:toxin-antitoxin system TumE family protein [Rhodopila globiformis]|uniref:toxin-antitoxin system TumE family protein n=1 Tax=Rhodopila globiformis TaxID=1071 RepID=UPI0026C3200B